MNPLRYFIFALLWALGLPAVMLAGLAALPFCITPAAVVAVPLVLLSGWIIFVFRRYLRVLKKAGAVRMVPGDCLTRYSPWYLPAFYYLAVLAAVTYLAQFSREESLYAVMGSMPHFFVWTFALDIFQTYLGGPDAAFGTLWPAITVSLALAAGMTVFFAKNAPPVENRLRGVGILTGIFACVAVACCVAYSDLRAHVLAKRAAGVAVVTEGRRMTFPYRDWMAEHTELSEYEPFSAGNQLVKIAAPELKIAAGHPKIYAAISFYPLAAAAVEGIYENVDRRSVGNEKLLTGGTSPQAFSALMNGDADMAFMFRPSDAQIVEAAEAGKKLTVTPIGREAFVFFVSRINPVENLSVTQIQEIYAKKITRWSEVGGTHEKILPFQRPAGSGSQTAMLRVMGDAALAEPLREEYQVSMRGIVNRVADYRNYGNSLGYSFRFYVQGMAADAGVRLLAVDGVQPTVENVRNGVYPLTEDVMIVTAGSENPHVAALVAWFLSPQGQMLVEKAGYVGMRRNAE